MFLVAVSQIFFGDNLTTQQIIAYAIATFGFFLFNFQQSKKRENKMHAENTKKKQF
jgi:hypothetical protein